MTPKISFILVVLADRLDQSCNAKPSADVALILPRSQPGMQLFSNNGRNFHRLDSLFAGRLHLPNFLRDAHAGLGSRDVVANRSFWCSFWLWIGHDHLHHIDLDVQIRHGLLVFVRLAAKADPESVLSSMAIMAANRANLVMR